MRFVVTEFTSYERNSAALEVDRTLWFHSSFAVIVGQLTLGKYKVTLLPAAEPEVQHSALNGFGSPRAVVDVDMSG